MNAHDHYRYLAERSDSAASAARQLFPRDPASVYALSIEAEPNGRAVVHVTEAGMDAIWDTHGLASDDPDETLDHLHAMYTDGGKVHIHCTYDTGTGRATGIVRVVAVYDARPGWLDQWEHAVSGTRPERPTEPEGDLAPALAASLVRA